MGNTKSHQKWVAENTTRIVMNLNHNTDRDVLEKLSAVDSKQGYIKELIRADIARERDFTRGMTRRQKAAYEALSRRAAQSGEPL